MNCITGKLARRIAYALAALTSFALPESSRADAPYANTQAAIAITSSNLVLQGAVSPNGMPSFAWFEWGTNSSYGNTTAPIDAGSTTAISWVTNQLSITAGIVYHYRVVCSNDAGIASGNERICGFQGHVWGALSTLPWLTNVAAIASSYSDYMALRDDASILTWDGHPGGYINIYPTNGHLPVAIAMTANGSVVLNSDHTINIGSITGVGAVGLGSFSHGFAIQTNGNLIPLSFGAEDYGQLTVPPGLSNAVAATGGQETSIILRDDGTLVAWGGDENNLTNVPAGLSNVVAVKCGDYQCLALLRDGTLRVWGVTSFGNLTIPPAATNIVAIDSVGGECFALRSDGQLFIWGAASSTQPPPAATAGMTNIVGFDGGLFLAADGAPVANSQTVSGPANHDIVITLTGTDPNTDALTYRIASFNGIGTLYQYSAGTRGPAITNNDTIVTSSTHQVIFAPPADIYGLPMATLHFVANDGIYDSAAASVAINVRGLPDVMTEPPIFLNVTNAVLQGAVVPNNFQTSVWFQWGTNTSYGNQTTPVTVNGPSVRWVTNTISDLTPRTTYHYRVAASNAKGTVYGFDQIFSPGKKVVAWDGTYNSTYATNAPANVSNVVAVAAGLIHDLALRADGKVIAWGNNSYGQTNVPVNATNVVAIAANYYHNLVQRADGTVIAWGLNTSGQTDVPSSVTNVAALAATGAQSFALRRDGTVAIWGSSFVPYVSYSIMNFSNIVALAAGEKHLLMLFADGTVMASGVNTYGQTDVPPGLSNVVAIAAGSSHSLALKNDGTVVAWGDNRKEQTTVPTNLPRVVAIAAGYSHSLALLYDGTVRGWGDLHYTGVTVGAGQVPINLINVVGLAAAGYHSLAIGGIGDVPMVGPLITAQAGPANATFSGAVDPEFLTTSAWFDYGLTTNYGQTTVVTNVGNGSTYITIWSTATNLSPATVYHYRMHATNSEGIALGADNTFTTTVPPFAIAPSLSTFQDGLTLTFAGPTNATYTVLVATNIEGQWFPLGPASQPMPGIFQFTDAFGTNSPTRYYRVQWP